MAKMQKVPPDLQKFVLPGARLTGNKLGTPGFYGYVVELEVNGHLYAGKLLHKMSRGMAEEAVVDSTFLRELQVISAITCKYKIYLRKRPRLKIP